MLTVGRLCVKIAGRDAGKKCVIVDVLDDKFVMVDGETRRRKCNILHLEPLAETMDVKKGASHEQVVTLFKEAKLEPWETKKKETKPRPKKQKKKTEKTAKVKKVKKDAKKEDKKSDKKDQENKETKKQ